MFIGHFAVGLALKRAAPEASLGVLIAAPQFLDILWPWFLLFGWERMRIDPGNTAMTPLAFDSYPISHSLVMATVLLAMYAGNLLGPPPSDPHSLALLGLGLVLFPLWAAWVDRHRLVVPEAP